MEFYSWRRFRPFANTKKIRAQWVDALMLASSALTSGCTVEQTVMILLSETPEPLRGHLRAQWDQQKPWAAIADKIEQVFAGEELALARAALLLSAETGGRGAGLIDKAATLLRRKMEMRDKLNALTSQGRFSAWVIGLLPFFLLAVFAVIAPDFIQPLFDTAAGRKLLALAVLLIVSGFWLISRLLRFDFE